ncbi:MAG: response regulator [Candidatus Doudnabacteria bacterium]|nr:response regulator [Candidatus Doudnabacteria bacterium]
MKHTILIVDDDALIISTLKKRFETRETEIFTAKTPEEAKSLLEKITPEVVVLDLLLTKEDGSSGIRDYLKSQERLEKVPVIVLTNLDKPELRQLLLSEGVKEYIVKGSITLDELYENERICQ